MTTHETLLNELRPFLNQHGDDDIFAAISKEDFSKLTKVPAILRGQIEACPDFWNDIWWYVEIRNEIRVEDHPCVHMAYAVSSRANHTIERHLNMYLITIDAENETGIVIGYCPWCAKELNTSAWSAHEAEDYDGDTESPSPCG